RSPRRRRDRPGGLGTDAPIEAAAPVQAGARHGGDQRRVQGSVITCPGRNVHQVISELVVLLDRLVAEQRPGQVRFLRGRWHNWIRRDKKPWTVLEELPEPDWAYR